MDEALDSAARAYLDSKSEAEMRRVVGPHNMITRPDKRSRRLKSNRRWQDWEIQLLGKAPDREAVRRAGRTLSAVSTKRVELRIPAIRTHQLPWTPEQIALLGKLPDKEAARLIGCYYSNVARKRLELGIPYTAQQIHYWTPEEEQLFGTMPDADVAQRLNRNRQSVLARRNKLGIPASANPKCRRWTQEEIALLGKLPDKDLARQLGRTQQSVEMKRLKLSIYMDRKTNHHTTAEVAAQPTPSHSSASNEAVANRLHLS